MCRDTTNNSIAHHTTLFSLAEPVFGKKINVDFNAPDISSNGAVLLVRPSQICNCFTAICNTLPRHLRVASAMQCHRCRLAIA